jgi:hypothetical protein
MPRDVDLMVRVEADLHGDVKAAWHRSESPPRAIVSSLAVLIAWADQHDRPERGAFR